MADERRAERASLGCGFLLLIIMALMFFFRPGITELEREVRTLRADVWELKNAIDSQSKEIKHLQEEMQAANGKNANGK